MIRSIRIWAFLSSLIVLVSGLTACGSKETPSAISAQSSSKTTATSASSTTSPSAGPIDMTKPESPVQTIFQAARDKNYELYRTAFSDAVPPEALSQQRFSRFVKRVNDGTLELLSGSEKVSETEALIKIKNTKKKKERAYRVRKIGDRWLIVGSDRNRQKGKQRQVQEEL